MNRGARSAAAARRARLLLAAALVLAVLGAGGVYLARAVVFVPGQAGGAAAGGAQATVTGCDPAAGVVCAPIPGTAAVAMSSAVVTVPPNRQAAGSSSPAARKPARPSASASGTPSAAPAAASSSATGVTPGGPPSVASGTPALDAQAVNQVLALINQARASAGLPALTVTAGLEASSSAHNALMADGCGLSHQCPGEAAIGSRETAAGVHWTACGENIGEGGPVPDTAAAIAQLAVGLTQSMLNERPPDDGHRMNILSSAYTHIGIAVERDSAGTVWLTQDFSN